MANRGDDRRARLRMNRDEQAAAAKNGPHGGGGSSATLCVPDGLEEWRPEEEGTYFMRVLPYEVTGWNPDGIRPGRGHYRRLYSVHFDVGGSGEAVICLKETFNRPDAICTRIKELCADYKANEEAVKAIRGKRFALFAVLVWKAGEKPTLKPKLFAWSYYKFAELLEKKLKVGEPEDLDFAQPDCGKVLKVQIAMTNSTINGKSVDFLETLSIEFMDGKSLANLPDAVIDAIPNLDECFTVPTPEHIAALFNGDVEDDGAEAAPEKPGKAAAGKPGKKPAKPADDEWGDTTPEGEGEGGESEQVDDAGVSGDHSPGDADAGWGDDEPPAQPGKKPAGKAPEKQGKPAPGKKTKPPADDADVW